MCFQIMFQRLNLPEADQLWDALPESEPDGHDIIWIDCLSNTKHLCFKCLLVNLFLSPSQPFSIITQPVSGSGRQIRGRHDKTQAEHTLTEATHWVFGKIQTLTFDHYIIQAIWCTRGILVKLVTHQFWTSIINISYSQYNYDIFDTILYQHTWKK